LSSDRSGDQELELKFTFDEGGGDAVGAWMDAHYPPHGRPWRTLEITDRYFDTPDLALSAARYGCRLRRVGDGWTLTVKTDVAGALHHRLAVVAPATTALDPRRWSDSEARTALLDIVGSARLIERFVVGQQRRERELTVDGTELVASIDEGEVEFLGLPAGDIRQFELELRAGDAGVLEKLRVEIEAADIGLVAEPRSKLATAARLADATSKVAADDRWSDACRKIQRRLIVRLLERETATRAGDALALKQMRVATRRMRATWRAFRGAFAGPDALRLETRLRYVAGLLGKVRDLDVLIDGVATRDDLQALADAWRGRRSHAYELLIDYLESRTYDRFVDEYLNGTGARMHWTPGRQADELVRDLVPDRLARALSQMVAAADAARGSHDQLAWHALRIMAKRMRYSLEAFRDVLDEDGATAFIEPLRSLQDVLGEMNDASVAAREAALWLTTETGGDAASADRVAAAGFIAECETRVAVQRAAVDAAWAAVPVAEVPALSGP
jgi:CHAD domain-containing protein